MTTPHPPASPPPPHAGRVWRRLQQQVIAEEQVCGICGRLVDKSLSPNHRLGPTVDCVVPRSLGGDWRDRANLRLAHRWCNTSRGNGTRRRRRSTFATSRRW